MYQPYYLGELVNANKSIGAITIAKRSQIRYKVKKTKYRFSLPKLKKPKVSSLYFKIETCEMHKCLRKPMALCRWAGFFPVDGLNRDHMSQLRFNLKSLYSLYCAISLIGQLVSTAFTVANMLKNDLSLKILSNCLFTLNGIISSIIMIKLARKWPQLIKIACDIELCISKKHIKNVPRRCNAICYSMMLLALVEHTLYKVFIIHLAMTCNNDYELSTKVIDYYFQLKNPHVFYYVTYSLWNAILFEWISLQSTFLWNFTDVITMCVSIYLISCFRELNNIINDHRCKKSIPWDKLRVHYSHLVELVKQVDAKLNHFILFSLFSDLYFICVQLFNAMNQGYSGYYDSLCDEKKLNQELSSPVHFLYYTYSTLFLVSRTLAMCLLAANVNTAAQEPSMALCEIPAFSYNIEVQRFHRQVRYTTIALSGVFFYVTRKMILKVVGTIITYEIVLMQFEKSDIV